jgi:hypothetical protein
MLHIATVHWLDSSWIDIQCRYLANCLKGYPYRIYAYLNGIDPRPFTDRFHYINTDNIAAHITKLNLLAEEICRVGNPGDIIIFIDGDAFPVQEIVPFLEEALKTYPLVAIKRLENDGDPQPHPSFCATTIGFWQEIEGDWSKGPHWLTNSGIRRSDTGAVLWEKLNRLGIAWKPILRSNTVDYHPLWFGVYGKLIYHHGAAFRTPYCTIDIREANNNFFSRVILAIVDQPTVRRLKGGWFQNAAYSFVMKKRINQTKKTSTALRQEIEENPLFYKQFSTGP